ncbi:LPXTG cell wall anchor domain-containing protein [Phytohabitans suffuscus]|uniref:Gram-positive cocci surface proteins LPxTG domain-containing protein n=1 Tax=Phytohabitans suffuscus TaxID=624315 RepID=A0A6F8YF58_9ACTN|nr:LPXTG cell wall anchor domain-containing protein [Phytohabitans suffuscus]BCB84700.1 hypothetical protein Psuf_020130 [Phytohabitans suffuscus]
MLNRHMTRSGRHLARGSLLAAVAVLTAGLGALGAAPSARAQDGDGQSVRVTVPEHTIPPGQASLACTGAGGGSLGQNPTLHPGDQLSCTGTGFAGGEQVAMSLGPQRPLGAVAAGQDGTARRDISLPADLGAGRRTLTFNGQASKRSASFEFTVTIVATVPVGGGGGGSLPRTGANLIGLAAAGVGLVVAGGLLTAMARRRTRRAPGVLHAASGEGLG